jgi:hypothetical protein
MKLLFLLILPLVLISGCVGGGNNIPGSVTVPVIISDGGICVCAADIEVNNLRENATVEVIYAIKNDTQNNITPSVYFNFNIEPADYKKAEDYQLCPEIVKSWLSKVNPGEIVPAGTEYCSVMLRMPREIKDDLPDKYTFRVGIAGNKGGFFQTGVETWWLVSMR